MAGCDDKWCRGVPRTEVARGDTGYPKGLLDLAEEAPERLYVLGDPDLLLGPTVAVTGSRKSTPYGEAVAALAGACAASAGLTLVTGGTIGCEAAAARAAIGHRVLDSHGCGTVVFSACGADVVYPPQSEDVFEAAARRGGAVVSAEPWGTGPRLFSFPKRKFYMAALVGTLVVAEAGLRSGTYAHAERANALGREVWATPGGIFSPESAGANALIASGEARALLGEAQLREIMQEVGQAPSMLSPGEPGDGMLHEEDPVMAALSGGPLDADDLVGRFLASPVDVISRVASLETDGRVVRLPDGRYSLSASSYLAPTAARVIGQAGAAAARATRASHTPAGGDGRRELGTMRAPRQQ